MSYPAATEQNTDRMTKSQSELFIHCVMAESHKPEFRHAYVRQEGDAPLGFLSEIIYKRITVLELPITFTLPALLAISALADNPGKAVVVLVDCLNKYEGQLVSTSTLADLYPAGFYNREVFEDIVDNYMKPRKHKWSELY